MERDSMLAHGAAFMLNDRLMQCSDYSQCYCCSTCGSIISVHISRTTSVPVCLACKGGGSVNTIALPFVFRYLVAELGAFSIRCNVKTNTL
jgi:DNA-directed RNA polymerase I subunit RPA2